MNFSFYLAILFLMFPILIVSNRFRIFDHLVHIGCGGMLPAYLYSSDKLLRTLKTALASKLERLHSSTSKLIMSR